MSIKFKIEKKYGDLCRAGIIETANGNINTPAFVTVGTKATVKALSPEQVKDLGSQVVLANTYHLYLEPGDKIVDKAGGLSRFMNWNGPTMTDSGGFQVFSLGSVGKNNRQNKFGLKNKEKTQENKEEDKNVAEHIVNLAKIDEDGVTFKSVIDGSEHKFTPERSMEIQHNIGADIMFAFDECTSPLASYEYQREAMDRTHRWAKRSIDYHNKNNRKDQSLFGIVQGGRYEDLRKESAQIISKMDFDGFGIGGSFDKKDMYSVVGWVNKILPENKPKHLLGIGEPADFFGGIENGADTFDCVAPTRLGRNGAIYTKNGRINIQNAKYKEDFGKIDDCYCYTCKNYTPAYLSHLFRSNEMFAGTLASIHNLYFLTKLVEDIRKSIIDGTFKDFKESFLAQYYKI